MHTWRVFADDDFDISVEIAKLIDPTTGPIDHWFDGEQSEMSVYSGRGPAPVSPHIEEHDCLCSEVPEIGTDCRICCGTGVARHWKTSSARLDEEAAIGLRTIIRELELT
jgi:hypothetical protein